MRVRDIAARAVSDLGLPIALASYDWVNNRFQEWATEKQLKPFRKLLELTLPATVRDGVATATKGSNIVTGDATAIAAWSPVLVGRFIKLKINWYEIASVGTTLILKSNYVEDTITAGAYNIVERRTKLDPRVRWVGAFINGFNGNVIEKCSLEALDTNFVSRRLVSGGPTRVAELGYNDEDILEMEFYPPDTKDVLIRYTGYVQPPDLKEDDFIPRYLDPYLLIEGVKINAMQMKAAEAANAGNAEIATFWRNASDRDQTRWERKKAASQKASEAVDDATFILKSFKTRGFEENAITDVRSHLFAGWEPLS